MKYSPHDIILPFLIKSGMMCSIVILTVAIPLVIYNFYIGEIFFASFISVVLAFNAWNAYRCYTNRYHEGANAYLFAPMIAFSVVYAITLKGLHVALWSYIAVIVFFFILPEKKAVITGAIFIVLISLVSSQIIDPDITARLVVTLTAEFVLLSIFLHYLYSLHHELKHKSISDPMTRLLNRDTLQESLENCFVNPSASTLLMVDVDHFKRINDELGHSTGDEAIKSFAQVIKKFGDGQVKRFRLGGEEFLMLFQGQSKDQVISLAADMQAYLKENPIIKAKEALNETSWNMTCSMGIAESLPNDNVKNWMNRVDAKLYEAKSSGRNRICY